MGGGLVRGKLCARRRAKSERAGEWQRKGNKRRGLGRSTGQSEVNAAHVRKPNYSLGRRWVPMRHGLTAIASLNAMRCLANISARGSNGKIRRPRLAFIQPQRASRFSMQ